MALPDAGGAAVLPAPVAHAPSRGRLLQVLGVSFGVAVTVGTTIQVGILRTPGDLAAWLPHPALFIGVWVLGGMYALLGAMSMAEPAAMIARSGGQYVLVRRGLGEYPGFVVGWSDWLSTCASVALGAMVFTEYLQPLLPGMEGRRAAGGVALVLLFGLLLWRGIRAGDFVQQLLSALKALAFGSLIAVCLLLTAPARDAAAPVALPAGMALLAAVVLALQAVIFTYDGWTGPIYFGEEVRDAGRSLPRAMMIGVLVVTLIYVLVNVGLVRVLGLERMAGDPFVAATAGRELFGERGDFIIRSLVLVSILGGMNASLLMAPRVVLAMGRDRLLPGGFESVNPGGTPAVGHWTSVAVAMAFIVSGTFATVLALCAFFFVASYAMSFLSVFALRRSEPDTPRPYRAPGYPYTTGLVLVASLAFLVGAVVADWENSRRSLLLLALSYPVYRWILARRRRSAA